MQRVFKRYEIGFEILVIVLVGAAAYLLLAHGLGYYRDDWHIVFGGRLFGPGIFPTMFSIDRPFVGLIYLFLYRILGDAILNWQLAAFAVRLMGVLAMFWIVLMLWPRQRAAATSMAVLAIVYPGFLQQPNAMTYINQEITLTMAVSSIALTLAAYRSSGWLRLAWMLPSLLAQAAFLMSYEYMIGLEGMRLALLYYLEARRQPRWRANLLAALRKSIPYLVVLLLFLVWRVAIFHGERPAVNMPALVNQYLDAPAYQVMRVFATFVQDLLEITFGAWFVNPYHVYVQLRLKDFLAGLALGAGVFALTYGLVWSADRIRKKTDEPDSEWAGAAMLIGAFSLLAAALPVIVAGREVTFDSILTQAFDRYSLQSSLAAVLMLTGALFHPAVGRRVRAGFLGLCVVLGILSQYGSAVIFRESWSTTRQFWWQLAWRAPQLKPGTNLIASFPGTVNAVVESYQVAYPAGLIFYPDSRQQQISSEVLDLGTVEKVIVGLSESGAKRTIPFERDFRNTLVAYFPSENACLHVIDGGHELIPPGTAPSVRLIAPYSDIGRILTDRPSHTPPADIFGESPAPGWCYYYQRASLAVQQGDWQAVVRLGDEAQELGLKPYELSEWWPFILGYADQGRSETAGLLISRLKDVAYLRHQVCSGDYDFPPGLTEAGSQFIAGSLCNR